MITYKLEVKSNNEWIDYHEYPTLLEAQSDKARWEKTAPKVKFRLLKVEKIIIETVIEDHVKNHYRRK